MNHVTALKSHIPFDQQISRASAYPFACGSALSASGIDFSANQALLPPPPSPITPTIKSQNLSTMPSRGLHERLVDYEARGILSRQDFMHYRQLLQKHHSSEYYIRQITKDLDQIARRSQPATAVDSPNTERISQELDQTAKKPQSILKEKKKSGQTQPGNRRVSWEDQSPSPSLEEECDKENGNIEQELSPVLLEPADLWRGSIQFNEQQLQELFVEMCFFARLGFVQPPCCLQCTYNDTVNSESNNKRVLPKNTCRRWVVWRKNAQAMLHPNRLDGNIIIVQCHVARSLLAGRVIEGRQWDATARQVVQSNRA